MSDRSRTYRKQKHCIVCGKPISSDRRSYCSKDCCRIARNERAKNDRVSAKEMGMSYKGYVIRIDRNL